MRHTSLRGYVHWTICTSVCQSVSLSIGLFVGRFLSFLFQAEPCRSELRVYSRNEASVCPYIGWYVCNAFAFRPSKSDICRVDGHVNGAFAAASTDSALLWHYIASAIPFAATKALLPPPPENLLVYYFSQFTLPTWFKSLLPPLSPLLPLSSPKESLLAYVRALFISCWGL